MCSACLTSANTCLHNAHVYQHVFDKYFHIILYNICYVCVCVCVLVPVREARLKEIRVEMLNSEKLKVCFNRETPSHVFDILLPTVESAVLV